MNPLFNKGIATASTESDLRKENADLKARLAAAESALKTEEIRRRELEWQIALLKGKKYKPSSEKIPVEQLELMLEGLLEQPQGPEKRGEVKIEKVKKHYRSRKASFPDDLDCEVIEVDLPEAERICPDTGKPRDIIRWEESVKYEWVPGRFKKIVIRRAVRAAKYDESDPLPSEPVVTAEMPAQYRVIPGCFAGIQLIVHILVSKYCDHLPLYRQQQIFEKRHGVILDRTLMGHWLKRISQSLQILYEALRLELLSGQYLQIDETFIKLIDPDTEGKTKQAYFWVIKHPKGGVLFHFDPGRSHEVPLRLLSGMGGKLQSDGYGVYETLLKARAKDAQSILTLILFNCWAHARRKIEESLEANGVDAAWYLREIQKLYAVETKARESHFDHEQRGRLRASESRPILAGIKERMDADLKDPSRILPSSPLGKGLKYMAKRWDNLAKYADDGNGEVEIDNNEVENAIRPTAVGKKNWLFIGHPKAGQMSAIIYTMIESCRMAGINPYDYLADVLPRIGDHPASRIAELLPRQWAERKEAAAA